MSKEEILKKAFNEAKIKYPNEDWKRWDEVEIEKEFIYKAMTEYAHQAIEEAAEVAETECENPGAYPEFQRYSIDKKSILKLKEKY